MKLIEQYCIAEIKANLDIFAMRAEKPYNKEKANKYFRATSFERLNSILDEVRGDAKKGDIFDSLSIGRIDPLARVAADVSLRHGLMKYAEEIYNNAI